MQEGHRPVTVIAASCHAACSGQPLSYKRTQEISQQKHASPMLPALKSTNLTLFPQAKAQPNLYSTEANKEIGPSNTVKVLCSSSVDIASN